MAEAKRFDMEHEGDEDYCDTDVEHVKDFILYFWGVQSGRVT